MSIALRKLLIAKLRDAVTRSSYLPRAFALVWASARRWTIAWAVLLAIQGLLPVGIVYLSKVLVDSLVAFKGGAFSWDTMRLPLIIAGLLAVLLLLTELLQALSDWIRTAQAQLVQDHISNLVHAKSASVDLAFYDSPEYYDNMHRARDEAASRPLSLLDNLGGLLQNSITLVAMAVVLLPYGTWLPLALFASTLPALYVVLRFNWRYHRWWEESTAERRRAQYYDTLLTQSAYASELRLFDLGANFQRAYQGVRQHLRGERLDLSKDMSLMQLLAGSMTVAVTGAAMLWMLWRAMQGMFTLGDLALFYQAFSRGQTLARSLLANIGQIYSNSLFLGNLFEFLGLEPRVVDNPSGTGAAITPRHCISFHDITFRYPGSERPTLQNFSLDVGVGQTVAIVGANGAGKSTLLKLMCRFYDPESGCIALDGADIRDVPLKDLRAMISVLFQMPVAYYVTAAQNITLGDLATHPDRERVHAAARAAGADEVIAQLPHGYDTLLGKWFAGGSELSLGEWQRIALARAFLRQSQIILLDEPTSFMDSWAEVEWLERFRSLARGRTAIIITHRFTTAMRADVIHVMRDGAIVESGTHEELLAKEGLYAESWRAQVEATGSLEVEQGQAW